MTKPHEAATEGDESSPLGKPSKKPSRERISAATKNQVLAEYSHHCAICNRPNPQLHHIDEDPSNSDPLNLLPLCANCHLTDQHNPTRRIDVPKLQLFRRHKDPCILSPQFHPIYARQLFLDQVEPGDKDTSELETKAKELLEFVRFLVMGDFYSKQLAGLLEKKRRVIAFRLDGAPDPELERQRREYRAEYRQALIDNRERAQELLIEMLRYQPWANNGRSN